jgi:hypothetical protein
MIPTLPNLGHIELEIEWTWITYDEQNFWFTCECEDRLKLDPIVVRRFIADGATKLIEHIVNTQVLPWLNEHRDCGKMSAFAA